MSRPSRLHIPHPSARPGEAPDFSYLRLSAAGTVARPDPSARLEAMTPSAMELSTELVRVLDDEHRAVGPWNPH